MDLITVAEQVRAMGPSEVRQSEAALQRAADDICAQSECRPLVDVGSVVRLVTEYAHLIGCDDSNLRGAVAWAKLHGVNTMHAVRIGKQRADQLRQRQPLKTPESAA